MTTYSVFEEMLDVRPEDPTAPPLPGKLEMEFVYKSRRAAKNPDAIPTAIYLTCGRKRIATRYDRRWISIADGVVMDDGDATVGGMQ